MKKVTFYLLENPSQSPEYFACRLIDKAWRQGLAIHVHTQDENSCKAMDQLLWSWREESFIPHVIVGQQSRGELVTLGHTLPSPPYRALLVNLSLEVPDFFREFDRVCEVVMKAPDKRTVSRNKFRADRQAGIEPEVHTM